MSIQSSSEFLNNNLSTEFDRESAEMRLARVFRKYEHFTFDGLLIIVQRYFTKEQISAAFKLYIDGKV